MAKVDSSDRVRWAVNPGGKIYFLNTEAHRSEEVIVKMSPNAENSRFTLLPEGLADFERYLDEIAARPWFKIVVGEEARKAYPKCR